MSDKSPMRERERRERAQRESGGKSRERVVVGRMGGSGVEVGAVGVVGVVGMEWTGGWMGGQRRAAESSGEQRRMMGKASCRGLYTSRRVRGGLVGWLADWWIGWIGWLGLVGDEA